MEKLHDDVLSNILIRLRAKQLAQLRCVSKPWNALLCEPSFVKSHLNLSIQNNSNHGIYLFLENEYSELKTNHQFRAVPYRYPCKRQIEVVSPNVFAPSVTASFVYGSVNGLICFVRLSDPNHIIYIWNPSLSALLPLPSIATTADISSCSSPMTKFTRFACICRFGFDHKGDDYKVVTLICSYELPNTPFLFVKEWLQVEVYSMRKGSWKYIPQRFPSHISRIYNERQVCLDGHDGHLHWLGFFGVDMKQQTIVAFDLHDETFSEIALPDAIIKANAQRHNFLAVLDGRLSIISKELEKFEVWVMNDYGVTESWVKHHLFSKFSNNLDSYRLISQYNYNEFLSDPPYRHLALHVNKVKTCSIMGISFDDKSKFIQYVDSLVWVAPAKSRSTLSKFVDCSFVKEPRGKTYVQLLLIPLLCMIGFKINKFMSNHKC